MSDKYRTGGLGYLAVQPSPGETRPTPDRRVGNDSSRPNHLLLPLVAPDRLETVTKSIWHVGFGIVDLTAGFLPSSSEQA